MIIFKQQFGRLVRTPNDCGEVYLCSGFFKDLNRENIYANEIRNLLPETLQNIEYISFDNIETNE